MSVESLLYPRDINILQQPTLCAGAPEAHDPTDFVEASQRVLGAAALASSPAFGFGKIDHLRPPGKPGSIDNSAAPSIGAPGSRKTSHVPSAQDSLLNVGLPTESFRNRSISSSVSSTCPSLVAPSHDSKSVPPESPSYDGTLPVQQRSANQIEPPIAAAMSATDFLLPQFGPLDPSTPSLFSDPASFVEKSGALRSAVVPDPAASQYQENLLRSDFSFNQPQNFNLRLPESKASRKRSASQVDDLTMSHEQQPSKRQARSDQHSYSQQQQQQQPPQQPQQHAQPHLVPAQQQYVAPSDLTTNPFGFAYGAMPDPRFQAPSLTQSPAQHYGELPPQQSAYGMHASGASDMGWRQPGRSVSASAAPVPHTGDYSPSRAQQRADYLRYGEWANVAESPSMKYHRASVGPILPPPSGYGPSAYEQPRRRGQSYPYPSIPPPEAPLRQSSSRSRGSISDSAPQPQQAHGQQPQASSSSQQRQKPQCWDHGCNGREFSTFSNLLRHQRERSGTAAKSYCPRCGAEFTRSTARTNHLMHSKCKPRRAGSLG